MSKDATSHRLWTIALDLLNHAPHDLEEKYLLQIYQAVKDSPDKRLKEEVLGVILDFGFNRDQVEILDLLFDDIPLDLALRRINQDLTPEIFRWLYDLAAKEIKGSEEWILDEINIEKILTQALVNGNVPLVEEIARNHKVSIKKIRSNDLDFPALEAFLEESSGKISTEDLKKLLVRFLGADQTELAEAVFEKLLERDQPGIPLFAIKTALDYQQEGIKPNKYLFVLGIFDHLEGKKFQEAVNYVMSLDSYERPKYIGYRTIRDLQAAVAQLIE